MASRSRHSQTRSRWALLLHCTCDSWLKQNKKVHFVRIMINAYVNIHYLLRSTGRYWLPYILIRELLCMYGLKPIQLFVCHVWVVFSRALKRTIISIWTISRPGRMILCFRSTISHFQRRFESANRELFFLELLRVLISILSFTGYYLSLFLYKKKTYKYKIPVV